MKITGIRYEMRAYNLNSGGVDVDKQRRLKPDRDKASACVTITVSDEAKRLYQKAIVCDPSREEE